MYRPGYFLLILFYLALPMLSFSQDTVYFNKDWKTSTKDQANYYRLGWLEQDHRYRVEDHYLNGKIQMTGYYLDGINDDDNNIKDGNFVYYDSVGLIVSESAYHSGVPVGVSKYYFKDTRSLYYTVEAKPDSSFYYIYYDSTTNSKKSEGKRHNGDRIDTWKFYFKGSDRIRSSEDYRSDSSIYFTYFDSATHLITSEGAAKNSRNVGQWRYYFANTNDTKSLIDHRHDSTLYCIYYDSITHKRISEGTKKDGIQTGIWQYYFHNTNDIKLTIDFIAGSFRYMVFFDSLTYQRKSEGRMVGDRRVGIWKYYTVGQHASKEESKEVTEFDGTIVSYSYEDGREERRDIYKAGTIVSGHCYDARGIEQPYVKIYTFEQQAPVAGYDSAKYVSENFNYLRDPETQGAEGVIVVRFVVNENGSISGAQAIIGLDDARNKEAVRVVTSMPKWRPARQNKVPVKAFVLFTIPIPLK